MGNNKKSLSFYIFTYWYDPQLKKRPGGPIRIFDLASNLKQLGHSVILFSPKIGYPKTQTSAKVIEVPFIDLPILRPLSFHMISSLMLILKIYKPPTCIYVRQMNSLLLLLIAKLFKVPSLYEIPNDPYLVYREKRKIRLFFERTMDKCSMMLTDRIVVLSEWTKGRLHQIGGIPLSKIIVLPSGTDTKLFRPLSKEECCNKLGFDASFLYVGFVGSFFSHQGIDTLIDCAPNILDKFGKTRFLLVGDGPMMRIWKDEVIRKRLQSVFIFAGLVPYRKVPEYIGVMDICVAPHREDTNQSSPVKLFDYMACGRPIVASDIEAVREIVGDSGCALLTGPGDSHGLSVALISLIKKDSSRRRMSHIGRLSVTKYFDRKKITEDLVSYLRELFTQSTSLQREIDLHTSSK
jgi:glycosyltransferase involved in cell wall biosynthesis